MFYFRDMVSRLEWFACVGVEQPHFGKVLEEFLLAEGKLEKISECLQFHSSKLLRLIGSS